MDYEAQTRLLKALAHPTRLAILNILSQGEECVCHMEATLGLRQAYISQQLMVLRDAGLVQDRRDGWNIFYRMVEPKIAPVLEALNLFFGAERVNNSRPARVAADDCPCPKCQNGSEPVTAPTQVFSSSKT